MRIKGAAEETSRTAASQHLFDMLSSRRLPGPYSPRHSWVCMDAVKNKSRPVSVRISSENGALQNTGIIQPARSARYRKRGCGHAAPSVAKSSSREVSRDGKERRH